METIQEYKRPTKSDRKIAQLSYQALSNTIAHLNTEKVDIEIEGSNDKIVLPLSALKLLEEILKNMSQGKIFSIVPVATEVTTQKAAEILGCSRPHLIKILEEGKIPITKVGRHRRIMFEDVVAYKRKMKEEQKQHIIDIMSADEEDGLYDT